MVVLLFLLHPHNIRLCLYKKKVCMQINVMCGYPTELKARGSTCMISSTINVIIITYIIAVITVQLYYENRMLISWSMKSYIHSTVWKHTIEGKKYESYTQLCDDNYYGIARNV